jgi:nicotinamide-nucleotide amidase
MSALRGAVVAVGDELLLGDVINSNAAWLGAALAGVGVDVVHSAAVGDDADRIVTAVRRAAEDADVVVLTGGLGPTSDDLTRDAIAALAGVPLERHPEIEQQLREVFASYGYVLQEQVLQQADVPRGATVLDNPVGTAPGLHLEIDGCALYALPGPPHELRAVMQAHVLPGLAERTRARVTTRTLRCAGAGESSVAERVEAAVTVPDGVDLAFLSGEGIVRVRFSTRGDDAVLGPLVDAAAAALGDDVFGHGEATLAEVVGALLRARGELVATAESLTGGLLGAALSGYPGSSSTYRGGIVAYATDNKHTLVGVPLPVLKAHGAVSAQTAQALALGVRERAGAHWGVSTTGVAGPDQQEGKAVGTVHVAVDGPLGCRVRSVRLPGGRDRVRALTVTVALDLLRRTLLEVG